MVWLLVGLMVIFIILYLAVRYFYKLAIDSRSRETFHKLFGTFQMSESSAQARSIFEERLREEPWTLTSNDGLKLSASCVRTKPNNHKVALFCHGYMGTSLDMSPFYNLLAEFGYDGVLPDARGHGKSDGDYLGFGWPDRLDIIQWIERIINVYGQDVEILLYGISMGGATVMMVSGEKLPPNIKGIIEDCGYTSVEDEVTFQLKKIFKIPPFPLIPLTSLYTKHKAGYTFREASALEQVKKNTLPILMIHGEADDFVPYTMFDTVYQAAGGQKMRYTVPDAVHGASYNRNPNKYKETIGTFLSTLKD
ncbi:alpha/beta hydrolase [Erysipelothrix sp. HDW6C]|uniref:alpha/beta hydrolase n=1 Tax=Erysipelothrix sp. HDW6C TaxID=2714930 RepID=UPI00140A727A|nr:alpha/beta hydrolase [Erysipelothrix sp. HDW6C]QIK69707.1 alpha/beta hydrolase [Erysipelothrix sp. HDW6C]